MTTRVLLAAGLTAALAGGSAVVLAQPAAGPGLARLRLGPTSMYPGGSALLGAVLAGPAAGPARKLDPSGWESAESGFHAQGGPGPGHRMGGPRGLVRQFGVRGIDLTDSQRDHVRKIRAAQRDAVRDVSSRLRDGHRALAELSRAAEVDESAVRAASTTVANALADGALLRAKIQREVAAILTPEQQQHLAERRQRLQERRGERQQRLEQRRQRRQ
ncbi:MAG: Spy/CpxP family protein refolding chaperone [Acidobacteriota bacterium]